MPQGLACFRIHLLTSPKYPAACTTVLICFLFCLLYTAASVRILSVIQAVTRLPRRTSVCKLAYIYPFLCIYAYNSTSMRPPCGFRPSCNSALDGRGRRALGGGFPPLTIRRQKCLASASFPPKGLYCSNQSPLCCFSSSCISNAPLEGCPSPVPPWQLMNNHTVPKGSRA